MRPAEIAGDMPLQNRKISFVFAERVNSWALMVAQIGEGQDKLLFNSRFKQDTGDGFDAKRN
ncbi:MAG: hypothetical protein WCJ93_11280 [Methanomicrobiales archaeon]